jgi:hypothetical protein
LESASSTLSFYHVSSEPEETPSSLDDKIGSFTSFLPVITTGLIGLLPPQERGPLLPFIFVAYYVSCQETYNT